MHLSQRAKQTLHYCGLLQGKIADMYTTLSACRSYLYNVARACDAEHVNRKDCAGVFLYLAEKATQLSLDSVQCLGKTLIANDLLAIHIMQGLREWEKGHTMSC